MSKHGHCKRVGLARPLKTHKAKSVGGSYQPASPGKKQKRGRVV